MKFSPLIHSTLLSLFAAALIPSSSASPLVSVGDNVDIFFSGSSSLRWSSNIFRADEDEEDDIVWSVTPGFEVNLGRGTSNADLSVVTRYQIRRYGDLHDLDTELFDIQADGSYRSSRLDLSGSVYFREQKTSTGDVNLQNDLIESDVTGGRINGEYRFSPKFSFGAGFKYQETEYKDPYSAFFADHERYDIPLDIFYELTPKVDLSVGYTYSETDIDDTPAPPLGTGNRAYTADDHFINVGARGNLLAKLTGFFKVGYRTRDNDRPGSSSNSTLGFNSDLTWAATPKLTTRLALSRDFGVGGEGTSNETTTVSITSNYSINSFWAMTAFGEYSLRDYENDREDNQYQLGARVTYTPNQYWRFGMGYTYSENDSDDPTRANRSERSYEDHTFDVSASLRY